MKTLAVKEFRHCCNSHLCVRRSDSPMRRYSRPHAGLCGVWRDCVSCPVEENQGFNRSFSNFFWPPGLSFPYLFVPIASELKFSLRWFIQGVPSAKHANNNAHMRLFSFSVGRWYINASGFFISQHAFLCTSFDMLIWVGWDGQIVPWVCEYLWDLNFILQRQQWSEHQSGAALFNGLFVRLLEKVAPTPSDDEHLRTPY